MNSLFKAHPEANFLQTDLWRDYNEKLGRKVIVEKFGKTSQALMIVKTAKRGRYLEVPGGPLLNWEDKTEVKEAFTQIYNIAKSEKCVFVRFRPQLLNSDENREIINSLPSLTGYDFRPASFHLHAQNTVILDLEKPTDTILNEMRRQTRYEVRRAEKLALRIEKGTSKELFAEFHACQQGTAERQGFVPPSAKELEAEREAFGDNIIIYKVLTSEPITADGKKLVSAEAKTEEKAANSPEASPIPANSPICYGLFIKSGPEVEYFEAASTPLGRRLPGAYALQWHAIQDFKAEGYQRYNLWGIAPPDPANPETHLKNHRYAGVTTFKTGFGGTLTNFIPATDIVISPVRYSLNVAIETIRKKRRHL